MSLLMTTPVSPAADIWGPQADIDLLPPIEVLHPDRLVTEDSHINQFLLSEHDDRFIRYDVSPGESNSSGSDNGQDAYFPLDEEADDQAHVQYSDSTSIYPLSHRLDPFGTLPVSLNRFQEDLVSSHVHDLLDQSLKPTEQHFHDHVTASEPSIHMVTTAGFRITLARSALDRLLHGKYQGEDVRRSLEGAVVRHKTDAISTIQALTKTNRQPHQTEELLESLINLEKLEKTMGTATSPSTHLAQLREILRSSGGPLNIRSNRLSRLMVHFECLYGTGRQSYVWCEVDFLQCLAHVNGFFSSIWLTWRALTQKYALIADEMKNILGPRNRPISLPSILKDGSRLKSCLTHSADGRHGLSDNDRLELICQLTSLLTMCSLVVEQHKEPVRLQQNLDQIHEMVESTRSGNSPNEHIMWLLQNEHPDSSAQRLWGAAEHVWLLKHVSYNVQCMIKEWILKFLTGQPLERCFKLDAFYFSYAS